ncbi:glycoside hydrolase family 3 N-terminal domain-containing protein [Prochlorococcus marinus]|uniref:beta-N-acetylhexosaminidase n=1 Tax=Prochlorococcus marinus XMU1408 TaxID=2213228 RepID=A0A318R4I3_PROMR|nr:glycoside hydrolase family 3 N-terminal domain-containing protein [Prochlorococcus marinus]MBW3041176.1 beta-N-acetylhexosaminidase [Prochlorococcus marinus str. XMU1408]PYE03884.1 beta-N-acetylhexosaminidase [Prochlorococcus marinus XMU1408]
MNKSDLRRQVAELFIVRASGFNLDSQRLYPNLEASNSNLKRLLEEGVGGVIFFGGTVKELEVRCNVLKKWSGKPLLLCADIEEGVGQRFYGGTKFIPPMGIAQIYKKDHNLAISFAEKIGYFTGKEAKNIGLNWLLAPVCDINNNSNNPVINLRAWGEEPETVKSLTCAFQRGVSRAKMLTCAKHFPGHGNSEVDSHLDLPEIQNDLSKLEKFELIPFKSLINQGVNSVMIGHLFFPKIDPIYPATLSKRLITDLLRIKFKYDGLVVSDALVMNAISNKYSSDKAAVLAFDAGIDLIMMPKDIDEAIDSLTDAFYSGKISIERLHISRERRKKQLDLISNKKDFKKEEFRNDDIKNKFLLDVSRFSDSIIKKSIFIREESTIKAEVNHINLIQIDNFDQVSNKFFPALDLPKAVGFKNLIIHPFGISPWTKTNKKLLELRQLGNSKILVQLFVRGKPFIGLDYHNDHWLDAIKNLEIEERLSGIVIYGCPYLYDKIKETIHESIPLAYSPSQIEEAQNQILSRILQLKIVQKEIDKKLSKEFTD